MKSIDTVLIGIVFVVWAILTLIYATVDILYMPPAILVWGLGSLLFMALTAVIAMAEAKGRWRRRSGT